MLLQKAMRYYRLWIYTCNAVLLLGVLVFAVAAASVLGDTRSRFVPVPMYHPTFIYAYLALLAQGGLLQAVGCYGALRLNERWLNVYWLLMLLLLVGDVLVGVVWIFLFGSITHQLPAQLWARLRDDYGYDGHYTVGWDELQASALCCGVHGPRDYESTRWAYRLNATDMTTLPASCGSVAATLLHSTPASTDCSGEVPDGSDPAPAPASPVSSSTPSSYDTSIILSVWTSGWTGSSSTVPPWTVATVTSPPTSSSTVAPPTTPSSDDALSRPGCARVLQEWMQHCADVLFVLGYCVIAFLKLCFLGILRYEIKEMIQKIKMLNSAENAQPELVVLGAGSPTSGGGGEGGGGGGNGGGGGSGGGSVNHCGGDGLKEALLLHSNHVNAYDNGSADQTVNHLLLLDKKNVRSNGNNNDLELTELTRHRLS